MLEALGTMIKGPSGGLGIGLGRDLEADLEESGMMIAALGMMDKYKERLDKLMREQV